MLAEEKRLIYAGCTIGRWRHRQQVEYSVVGNIGSRWFEGVVKRVCCKSSDLVQSCLLIVIKKLAFILSFNICVKLIVEEFLRSSRVSNRNVSPSFDLINLSFIGILVLSFHFFVAALLHRNTFRYCPHNEVFPL